MNPMTPRASQEGTPAFYLPDERDILVTGDGAGWAEKRKVLAAIQARQTALVESMQHELEVARAERQAALQSGADLRRQLREAEGFVWAARRNLEHMDADSIKHTHLSLHQTHQRTVLSTLRLLEQAFPDAAGATLNQGDKGL